MDNIMSILLRKEEETRNFDSVEELDFITNAIKEYKQLKDKLHHRNMQIKTLKVYIAGQNEHISQLQADWSKALQQGKNKTEEIEKIYDIINNEKLDADETIGKISEIVSDN